MADKINISGPTTIGDAGALYPEVASGVHASPTHPEIRSDSAAANPGPKISVRKFEKQVRKARSYGRSDQKCPVCKYKQYDGENCTACGFDANVNTVEQFSKLHKKWAKEAKKKARLAKRQ